MSRVIIRDFIPLTDSGFIYSTMPKSIYYSGIAIDPDDDKRTWFEDFYKYLQALIPESEISIACTTDDINFIVGYSVVAGRTLQFVYVKEDYRKQGIARLLVKHNKQIREVNMGFVTRVGDAIIEEHKDFFIETEKSIQNAKNNAEAILDQLAEEEEENEETIKH